MDRYEKDYQRTKEDVLERSSRYISRNLKITIIAVLVALIAVCAFVFKNTDDICWEMMERSIASKAETYKHDIDQFMEDNDYLALDAYITRNRIIYSDGFFEYSAVFDVTQQYKYIYDDLMDLHCKRAGSENFIYTSEFDTIESISNKIHSFYEMSTPSEFHPEAFQGNKKEYMDALKEHLEIMISGYFGISLEDVAKMNNMSASKICLMLEGAYGK
jgi:hypothetical protein